MHAGSVFCAKHCEQLSEVGIIENLISKLTSRSSSKLLHVLICYCSGTLLYGMAAHVARHFQCLSDTCPNASHICKLVLFGSGTSNLNLYHTGV
jgi:hypothetical protein